MDYLLPLIPEDNFVNNESFDLQSNLKNQSNLAPDVLRIKLLTYYYLFNQAGSYCTSGIIQTCNF